MFAQCGVKRRTLQKYKLACGQDAPWSVFAVVAQSITLATCDIVHVHIEESGTCMPLPDMAPQCLAQQYFALPRKA